MDIFENLDISVSKKFMEGNIVFLVYENDKIKGMVVTKEDYEKKIQSHQYTPLLFIIPFHIRVAYLYGCLNHEFQKPNNNLYRIMWREIGTDIWRVWFIIKDSHQDNLYF